MNDAIRALLPAPAMQNLHDPSGIGHADTLDPQVPLSVRVGPYLEIAEGDIIDLFCDDALAFNYTVKREDLSPGFFNFVVLPLDQKFIHETNITLFYEVTKPIGGQKNTSTPAVVPVKLTIPGGTDTNPATPWENERLATPKVFPEGIITSPEGVTVEIAAYMNMFVGDRIALSWHGEIIRTEITDAQQVGQPLVIPVSKEIIERAGDSDMLEVRYEIRDIVNNWSRWSLPTYVAVEAGESTLPAPITPQAPGMELDLDQLAGADVQVLVIAHPDIRPGDELVLSMERSTAEGMALETYTASKTIPGAGSFYEFVVPNAQFQPIAQGRARLYYKVTKAAGVTLRSKSLQLKIIGQPMELPLPRVPVAEQNGGVLDPASLNVRVEVPVYYFMAEGNDVHLYWMGKTESGANVMFDELKTVAAGAAGMPMDFFIPDDKVSLLTGGSVAIHYTVNTFSRAFFTSPSLMLPVSANQSGPLPLPTILEAENDILDPANAPNGATVVIADSANLRQGDTVNLSWNGPNGSDQKEKSITQDDAGKALSVVFARALVDANDGQTVAVSYQVIRANGTSQDSEVYSVRVMSASVLPAPTMDTVQEDGVVNPGLIPEAGATVRARYEVRAGDRVKVIWEGASRFETAEQEATGGTELVFQLPKALITASAGAQATLSYQVSRGGNVRDSERRTLRVQNPLSLDTSPVTLGGKVYLVPSRPDALPTMPGGTTVQRQASGGTAPYTYTSADPRVAQVSEAGLVSVRGKGTTTITVADAAGQSLSYAVTVTGVIHCIELGKGNFGQAGAQAGNNQARLPSIQELREIHGMWAANWPLVKDLYWSSTLAKLSPFGKTYYQKALGSGMELDGYTYSVISAIGIR
ncbi:Ig-like domain-containing protein [Pseudomonas sp. NPDC090201]|uniref:Ig-like domain-containing protein n=1 Tax=Pseudomonas sp. NPDC090201 TaxID=3364475 RepID=UPI00382A9B2F